MRVRTSVLLTAALLGGASTSFAGGPLPQMADRVDSPGRSAVTEDTMESLRVNPANLAFLPAWELRYTGVFCKDLQKTDCGHALGLGTPLFLGLAAGIRFDYVLPPDSSPVPFTGSDSVWATYGLAWRYSNVFSLGLTLEHSYSHTGLFDDLTGVTAGASLRPNRFVALSVVARDFNAPNPTFLTTTGEPVLDRSYVGGIVVRPTGHRYLEVGFEAKYYDTAKELLPRWTGACRHPQRRPRPRLCRGVALAERRAARGRRHRRSRAGPRSLHRRRRRDVRARPRQQPRGRRVHHRQRRRLRGAGDPRARSQR